MKGVGGTYKISCFCKTTPTIATVASPGTIQNLRRDATTGRVTADLLYPEGGPQLMLTFKNTRGGVKNLEVLRPGTKSSDFFSKPFLTHISRFSNLRFMDWASTNGNNTVRWADRTPTNAPSYANGHNVPWEVCIALCNRLKKDAWINVPVQADDDYVKRLADLFRDHLDPSLHVYVEYSNEVWNWSFQQAGWNLNQAKAEVAAGHTNLNYDGSTDANQWAARRIAKRIKEISDRFRQEFGRGAFTQRVRPVLATQIAWPSFWLASGLRYLDDVYGPPNQYLYALAGAPYFNMGSADVSKNLTVDQVLTALNKSVEAMQTDLNMDYCATLAAYHNLKFVAYEGGSDTFGPNNIAAKKAASLDPRMRPLVVKYLKTWYGYGFELFNWFVAGATSYDSQYGTWGLTNDMTRLSSPKVQGIDDALALGSILILQGSLVPGSVDARRYAGRDAKWAEQSALQLSKTDWQGPYRDYLLRANQADNYKLNLRAAANGDGVKAEIWLNNVKVGTLDIPKTSGPVLTTTAKLPVAVKKGMNGLRLKIVAGDSVRVQNIEVK